MRSRDPPYYGGIGDSAVWTGSCHTDEGHLVRGIRFASHCYHSDDCGARPA